MLVGWEGSRVGGGCWEGVWEGAGGLEGPMVGLAPRIDTEPKFRKYMSPFRGALVFIRPVLGFHVSFRECTAKISRMGIDCTARLQACLLNTT